MTNQNYDEFYWKLTLAHSDFTGQLFNSYLAKIVAFIDTNKYEISINLPEAYDRLQAQLIHDYDIDDVSVRKAINQFVKLGMVHTGLSGYHTDTKAFLKEPDTTKKMTLFSRIVYSNSSFNRSVKTDSSAREINFLIKTLTANNGTLSKEEALALMTIDVTTTSADYADKQMIDTAVRHIRSTDFEARKYNQMRYLWSLLGKLDDLVTTNERIYFAHDPRLAQVESEETLPARVRDSYLQRLYKNLLIEESKRIYDAVVCMAEKLDYPGLIASHIKPYIRCNEHEAFDNNNGLLLSRNTDFLFDRGYITFTDTGNMLVTQTQNLSEELKSKIGGFSLDDSILNDARKKYLEYHRQHVFVP